jgi:hypothetical protein
VVCRNSKFAVRLDESTSLSKKACLIIYIRAAFDDEITTFNLDLVELNGKTASTIKDALITTLKRRGFIDHSLMNNWIGIATDGCSTMLEKINGLIALLQLDFPNLLP